MLDHMSVSNLLHSIIPISRFNKGEANKIFDEVNASGFKVVVKNNKPACVLLAPDKYEEMMETIENYVLFAEAEKRLSEAEKSGAISHESVLSELRIDKSELDGVEVDID